MLRQGALKEKKKENIHKADELNRGGGDTKYGHGAGRREISPPSPSLHRLTTSPPRRPLTLAGSGWLNVARLNQRGRPSSPHRRRDRKPAHQFHGNLPHRVTQHLLGGVCTTLRARPGKIYYTRYKTSALASESRRQRIKRGW